MLHTWKCCFIRILVRKALRLCKVSFKVLFISTNIVNEKRIVQIILCPFRCWHSKLCSIKQASAHCTDPVHSSITPFWSFELLYDFLTRKQINSAFLQKGCSLKTSCCTSRKRQELSGAIITRSKWELSTGPLVPAGYDYAVATKYSQHNTSLKAKLYVQCNIAQAWCAACIHSLMCMMGIIVLRYVILPPVLILQMNLQCTWQKKPVYRDYLTVNIPQPN